MERYEEAVFAAEHLCKEYRHTAALRDVTITIPRGQIYGLIGENGAGKTTLLRILMGLETADSGQIEGLNDERLSAEFQEERH